MDSKYAAAIWAQNSQKKKKKISSALSCDFTAHENATWSFGETARLYFQW